MNPIFYHINNLRHKLPVHSLPYYDFYQNSGSVFCLHRVIEADRISEPVRLNAFIELSKNKLEWIIETLLKMKVDMVGLADLEQRIRFPEEKQKPFVHFSFDDGYLDNYSLAFPIFKKYGIPFSIFPTSSFIGNKSSFVWWYLIEGLLKKGADFSALFTQSDISEFKSANLNDQFLQLAEKISTDWNISNTQIPDHIAGMCSSSGVGYPEMMDWHHLNEMVDSGLCQIGGHCQHHYRLSILSPQERRKEIKNGLDDISHNLGISTPYFAYPFGAVSDIGPDEEIRESLTSLGIRMAVTTQKMPLNKECDMLNVPRVFINDSSSLYSLKVRINGFYFKK